MFFFFWCYIAENVAYNLISTPENKKATGATIMSEDDGKTTERDRKMIYVTFFSYLQFI